LIFVVLLLALFSAGALAQVPEPGGVNLPDPVEHLERYQEYDVIQGEALVQFRSGAAAPVRSALHDAAGSVPVREIAEGLVQVRFDEAARSLEEVLRRYNAHPSVEFAEPNWVYYAYADPNDPKYIQQWGPKKIGCSLAWDLAVGDPGAVVAVIDSGIDMDHPDLNDHYAYGYDFYAGDALPEDTFGHGTHTAGTAAAEFNNAVGIAGVAGYCRFAAYRVGDYYLSNSAIISAINDATAKGALAISMSFGGGGPSTAMQNALNAAYNAGVVCVASAGNDGNQAQNYPAAFSSVNLNPRFVDEFHLCPAAVTRSTNKKALPRG